MDGHEREDVRECRDKVFLPEMTKFEAKMTQFKESTASIGQRPIDQCFDVPLIGLAVALRHRDSRTFAPYLRTKQASQIRQATDLRAFSACPTTNALFVQMVL
ncbi:hypothetical protein HGRIS_001303 [Hohenbuehelia grisea]|uniref:Uncharacterized protein n=1 Tax=Hohenbuehelia grisea TaxID=104357 RepID=A0ABR3IPG5_9AGAR